MYPGNRLDKDEDLEISNQVLVEGVGDLHCKICEKTHTKSDMLICERCGCGFHVDCL